MKRSVVSFVPLAFLAALFAGCADDEVLRRSEERIETQPTPGVLFYIDEQGMNPSPEAMVEARGGTVMWLNRTPSTCVTIRVKGAQLVSGAASTKNMAQQGPDILSTAAVPPGGIAAATIEAPGDYPYEIHGPTRMLTGVLRVRPSRGKN